MPMIRVLLFTAGLLLSAWTNATETNVTPAPDRRNSGSSAVQGAKPPASSVPKGATLTLDGSRALGDPAAPLFFVEFADYQCPYCRRFHVRTLPELQRTYIDSGVLRYFYKDFPLRAHAQAIPAAVAAHCAGAQGKYWKMHQGLYDQQARLGEDLYLDLARQMDIDLPRFKDCRMGSTVRRTLEHDHAEGRRLGVSATPTFVLGRIDNGRVTIEGIMKGSGEFDAFAKEIEKLRAKE